MIKIIIIIINKKLKNIYINRNKMKKIKNKITNEIMS